MWPYWIIFMFPALASIVNSRTLSDQLRGSLCFTLKKSWWLVIAFLTIFIGLRYRVGGDWGNYERSLHGLEFRSLTESTISGDPGYRLLEWLCIQNDWGITGVNLIGSILFSFGLVVFCRNLPRPWLALSVAIPYLVIVVAMGYTRQGIAIGLAMLGLVALGHQSTGKFIFWVLLGATFHKSAVLLLPIAALAATKKRLWTAIWIAMVVVIAYLVLLEKSVDTLYANYIEAEYQSQGALIRLSMNVIPAIILLLWRRRFEMSLPQLRLWLWMSVTSSCLFFLYFFVPASTAIDRVALYMLPLQLAIFAHIPEVFGIHRGRNTLFTMAILLYYAAVQFVWLNYATHARSWLPYQNWLFL